MAERDRPDTDSDLEFEFFEDLPTTERPARDVREPKPPAPPPPRRPTLRSRGPGAGTPLTRLALLIAGAIVLAVILILWVTSCRGDAAKAAYEEYMSGVTGVVRASDEVGQQLGDVITARGTTLEEVDQQLDGLVRQQAQAVTRAQQLDPPAPLVPAQQSLVEAMQLRESGLRGLKEAFAQIQLATEPDEAGPTLAEQAARVVAADVVYQDLFRARSQEVMRQQDVSGVAVPESQFLSSIDLVSQASLTQFVQRLLQGGATAGAGAHGNGIESVRVLPEGKTLVPTEDNTIAASDQLRFQVAVKNSGEFQETEVEVTLVIQFSGGPVQKTATVDLINPGQTKTVAFRDFTDITFGEPTTLKVTVKPVPGEENTGNNVAEYPVIFTLE